MTQHWLNRLILTADVNLSPIPAERIASAVLLPIYQDTHNWRLIMIRRSQQMRHHRGQFAFPGGRKDDNDASLRDTALRETFEEIQLSAQHIDVIAQLPNQDAGQSFTMTPFVGMVHDTSQIKANPYEVSEIFTLPLEPLLQTRHYSHLAIYRRGTLQTIHFIEIENRVIWGATAAVLYRLAQTNCDQSC
ncbi:CoA pyrophosphatase [Celerinatantimonas yamalensis]|uniref:CoA pyrophosphatase n=1 Tax=Celerinatantimonas yamalensis TaxID=559956 RepID=A0ABW9G3T2_9GAMM